MANAKRRTTETATTEETVSALSTIPTLRHAEQVAALEARITAARERVQELEAAERQAFRELQTAKALDGSTTMQSDLTLSKLRRAEFAHAEARSEAELAGEALQELASDLDVLHQKRPDPTAADVRAAAKIVLGMERERAPIAARLEALRTAAADADTLRQAAEAIAAKHALGTASDSELQAARAAAQAAIEAGEATAGLERMLAEIDTRLQAARDARDALQSEVDTLETLRVSRELEKFILDPGNPFYQALERMRKSGELATIKIELVGFPGRDAPAPFYMLRQREADHD